MPRALVHAVVVRAIGQQKRLACWLACFIGLLPLARRWVTEHRLAPAAPPSPHLTSVALLEREADIRLWCRHPRWNYHRGLSNRSILHPWCGCDKSELSPHAASPRRGEAEAPLPA
jgi:hypothetical protein